MIDSIWTLTAGERPAFPRLEQDMEADVAIIGAGMAGVLIAYLLKKRGVEAVVLEATRAGSGQTAGSTAKITAQHGLIYDKLITDFGGQKALQYATANQEAVFLYRDIIAEEKIDCDFSMQRAYVFAEDHAEALQREALSAARLGLPAAYVKDPGLPFATAGAVYMEEQAQFHPLKFLFALSKKLHIYEDSPVTRVEENRLYVNGYVLRAKHIVFATHFPFLLTPGLFFARMYQSRAYMLALQNAATLPGMYVDVKEEGLSLRNHDGLLLLAGMDHRTGENSEGGRYETLLRTARALWPACSEQVRWSAQDCITLDGVPYIGRFGPREEKYYVATGFAKWGITSSMVAAVILSSEICGQEAHNAAVFSPQRFNTSSIGPLFANGVQALRGLARQNLDLPEATLRDLPKGHGGIVDQDGESIGVYKDESGSCFLIDTRCPHMGCQLAWNPDEKSWDCPCHGSRFDYKGQLLDGPAQQNIHHKKLP